MDTINIYEAAMIVQEDFWLRCGVDSPAADLCWSMMAALLTKQQSLHSLDTIESMIRQYSEFEDDDYSPYEPEVVAKAYVIIEEGINENDELSTRMWYSLRAHMKSWND